MHDSEYFQIDYLSLKYRGLHLTIQNTKGDEYEVKSDVSTAKVVTVVVFIVAILYGLASLIYPQALAFPNRLVIIGAVCFVAMLCIVYQKKAARSFCIELQAILKEWEEWKRKERERIEKERIESEKASKERAERAKAERKKANKTFFERQKVSLKDEEWCFRPAGIQESKTNYVNSGEVTFDYDAGHYNDFCNKYTITGAYENGEFLAVIIPEGTKTIPEKAFAYCRNLRFVYIPDSVTLIDGGAFYGCRQLIEVSLPKGINIISNCNEWWHEYKWGLYDDIDHDDDYYFETFEDMSCLVYRERPLSAEEWLAKIKRGN